ncbi:MAG: hypothetical protein LUE99_03555 [Bacteroides sp.]|nr:hypothetical protein [Bacteroides sp.]
MEKPEINRLDLNILLILANEDATDELKGMTINEINYFNGEDKPLCTRANLSKRIRRLHSVGLMEKGIKEVVSDTFFITEFGLKTIKWNGGKSNE